MLVNKIRFGILLMHSSGMENIYDFNKRMILKISLDEIGF